MTLPEERRVPVSPLNQEHKVAVATVDGKALASHFGSAPLFVVYTVKKGRVLEEEFRVNRGECTREADETQAGCWELMERMLPDVRVVICRGMGENAYVGMLRRDVLPVTTDEEMAQEAITAYLKDQLEDNPRRVHWPRRKKRCRRSEEYDREERVELLASLPLDGEFASWADRGGAKSGDYHDVPGVAAILDDMVDRVIAVTSSEQEPALARGDAAAVGETAAGPGGTEKSEEEGMEVYAVPTQDGVLCAHFGHCEKFTLVEAGDGGEPVVKEVCDAPPHEPGLLPRWLADKGVKTVIAGGMGARAQEIFAASGVRVVCGAPPLDPLQVVKEYVDGTLEVGDNVCDH